MPKFQPPTDPTPDDLLKFLVEVALQEYYVHLNWVRELLRDYKLVRITDVAVGQQTVLDDHLVLEAAGVIGKEDYNPEVMLRVFRAMHDGNLSYGTILAAITRMKNAGIEFSVKED